MTDDTRKHSDHLILIGFMGSGKSTVARRIARNEEMVSVDMDTYIAREAGMSIPQIFQLEGEDGFRAREHAFLVHMKTSDRCILSCGGGVVTRAENRQLLKNLGTVIYLEVTAEEALSRISHPESRPMLSGSTSPAELLEKRRALYEETADIIFNTNGLTINQVTSRLTYLLKKRGIL